MKSLLWILITAAVLSASIVADLPEDWRSYIHDDTLKKFLGKDVSVQYSSSKFEGDISNIENDASPDDVQLDEKNVINNEEVLWLNGTVPYTISSTFSSSERKLILQAMSVITQHTFGCVKFRPQQSNKDFIRFVRQIGCHSAVGRQGGKQLISLARGCTGDIGTIQHEILHALGLYHEISRTDREQHVYINWDNIQEGNKKQFAIHTDVATFGLPYDYQSVMHYPVNAFAIDPYIPTIVPKIKGTRFGDYKIISALDAVKLQRAYKCFPDAVTVVDPDEDEDDTERDPPTQKSTPIGFGQTLKNRNPTKPDSVDHESAALKGDLLRIDKEALGQLKKPSLSPEEWAKWPKGVVPYLLSSAYSKRDSQLIVEAMISVQDNTCVKFRKRSDEEDYILVLPSILTCASYPGRMGKLQRVYISKGCMMHGAILTQLMHVVGFQHEHNRMDRDQYVEINYTNIPEITQAIFDKNNDNTFGLPYDYGSVMHLKNNSYARDKKQWTIRPIGASSNVVIGQRDSLSRWDVQRINKMYNCEEANKTVCGYLWTKPNFKGLLTVIYEGVFEVNDSQVKRHYASAHVLTGFGVLYYTEDAPDGVILAAQEHCCFNKALQASARRRECMRVER